MTDAKLQLDDETLDPAFARTCAIEAENKLYAYVNNPANEPMMSKMIGMFLNRVGLMRAMLKGVVDLHNEVVTSIRAREDESQGADVSEQLRKLALLATGCAVNFGDEIGHIVVRFDPATGTIDFDNIAGRGVADAPAPGAAPASEWPAPDEPGEQSVDPLLAAHDKGLH